MHYGMYCNSWQWDLKPPVSYRPPVWRHTVVLAHSKCYGVFKIAVKNFVLGSGKIKEESLFMKWRHGVLRVDCPQLVSGLFWQGHWSSADSSWLYCVCSSGWRVTPWENKEYLTKGSQRRDSLICRLERLWLTVCAGLLSANGSQ